MGKTTTCEELKKMGFVFIPESARLVIEEEQQKEQGILPWTNLYAFQLKVLERQLAVERSLHNDLLFLDRTFIDNIAYCRAGNIPIPPELHTAVSQHQYTIIFVLDQLPNYSADNQRKEDPEYARKLHNEILHVYEELGYPIIQVPVLQPRERALFILKKINCSSKEK